MRRLFVILFVLLAAMVPALAEETSCPPCGETWFLSQYAALVPAGTEAKQQRDFSLPFQDLPAISLRLTVEGDLRFGRYAQFVRTALLDPETGDVLPLEAVFSDLDALQEFLDARVEEQVLDDLNTYLDANDLLPVPLDAVYFDESGVTFHYPAERFQFFSGHAGAVHLQWYELRDFLAVTEPAAVFPLLPGTAIDDLLAQYGSLTDPDLIAGGMLYEFESPALRGVQAVTDESGRVTAVRSARFSMSGAEPGMTREQAEAGFGEAAQALPLTEEAARSLRLQPGVAARRPYGADTLLTLYYDENDLLYLAEVSQE